MTTSPPYAFPHPGPPPERPELPEGVEPKPPRSAGWKPWTAPVALIAAFAVAVVGAIVAAVIGSAAGYSASDLPPGFTIGLTVVQDVALVLSAIVFASMAGRPRGADFGLRPTRVLSALGWMLAAYLAFLILSAIWAALVGGETNQDLPNELGADDSTAALVASLVLVCVIAPVAEEFFFRGFFFTAVSNWKGPWVSAALTGIVFGAIHAGGSPVDVLVPLAVFGVALCLLYWRTGSLYPCIALHAVNNALAFGVSQDWSWEIPFVMVGAVAAALALVAPLARLGRGSGAPAPA